MRPTGSPVKLFRKRCSVFRNLGRKEKWGSPLRPAPFSPQIRNST
jgi:hypothetical protein